MASTGIQANADSHKGSTIFEPFQATNGAPTPAALKLALERPAEAKLGHVVTSVDRRASLTPESPYKTSSETRARQDLLDQDEGDAGHLPHPNNNSRGSSARSSLHSGATSLPHAKSVNQVMGKASEMIGELAGIVAGVLPGMGQDGGRDPDSVRFFVSSPETSRRESLQPGYGTGENSRRASFTPESPYNVSDETRSRTNSLESDMALQQLQLAGTAIGELAGSAQEVRRSSGGIVSTKYARLD